MRYAAPIQVDDDDWTTPDPSGGLPAPSPWRAPILVDERDEEWNTAAVARATIGLMAGTPGPGNPMYDYLAGTREDMPTDEQLVEHARLAASDVAAMYDVPGEFVDPVLAAAAGYPEDTITGHPERYLVNGQPADADEMRTRIHDAETALATGHVVGNGPLTEPARAELAAIAAPPAWAGSPLDLPGRIEPVVFEPVRFAAPVIVDRDGNTVPPRLAAKRQTMIDIVKAYAQADPRSNQVEIGPSEIGDPCDARVMRRALGFPAITWPDPWASFVGTAVHAKLADAFSAANEAAGPRTSDRFLLERRVWMTDGMSGSTDLADVLSTTMVEGGELGEVDIYDHKVLGTDTFREVKKEQLVPTSKYGVQLDTYALGWRRAGFKVRTINLALWPRSGFLDGLLVIEREPDYANAEAAIDRVSTLRQWALERGADEADEPWQDVPTAPGKGCGFCSYYNPHRPLGRESCDKGREFMAGAKAGTGKRGATP
jgi:hypothetical protein